MRFREKSVPEGRKPDVARRLFPSVRTIAGPDYVRIALGRALDGATRAADVVASKAGDRRGKAADTAESPS